MWLHVVGGQGSIATLPSTSLFGRAFVSVCKPMPSVGGQHWWGKSRGRNRCSSDGQAGAPSHPWLG